MDQTQRTDGESGGKVIGAKPQSIPATAALAEGMEVATHQHPSLEDVPEASGAPGAAGGAHLVDEPVSEVEEGQVLAGEKSASNLHWVEQQHHPFDSSKAPSTQSRRQGMPHWWTTVVRVLLSWWAVLLHGLSGLLRLHRRAGRGVPSALASSPGGPFAAVDAQHSISTTPAAVGKASNVEAARPQQDPFASTLEQQQEQQEVDDLVAPHDQDQGAPRSKPGTPDVQPQPKQGGGGYKQAHWQVPDVVVGRRARSATGVWAGLSSVLSAPASPVHNQPQVVAPGVLPAPPLSLQRGSMGAYWPAASQWLSGAVQPHLYAGAEPQGAVGAAAEGQALGLRAGRWRRLLRRGRRLSDSGVVLASARDDDGFVLDQDLVVHETAAALRHAHEAFAQVQHVLQDTPDAAAECAGSIMGRANYHHPNLRVGPRKVQASPAAADKTQRRPPVRRTWSDLLVAHLSQPGPTQRGEAASARRSSLETSSPTAAQQQLQSVVSEQPAAASPTGSWTSRKGRWPGLGELPSGLLGGDEDEELMGDATCTVAAGPQATFVQGLRTASKAFRNPHAASVEVAGRMLGKGNYGHR